ncbi:MAG TPA: AraC family transcriptional regulator [Capsulimonadaceae bacterium]
MPVSLTDESDRGDLLTGSIVRYVEVDEIAASGGQGFRDGYVHRKTVPYAILANVVTGRYSIECDGDSAQIEPGELFLVPPNRPLTIGHSFAGAPSMESQWVHFRATLNGGIDITSLLDMPLRVAGPVAAEMGAVIAQLRDLDGSQTDKRGLSVAMARSLHARSLAYRIIALVCDVSHPRQDALAHAGWSRLTPVLDYIRGRLSDTICVDDLAQVACMSVSHFHAEFKSAFGEAPMDYVRRVRIEATCRRLVASTDSVGEIAATHGFASPYHFSRVFKAASGQPPSQYRKANRPDRL